MNVYVCISREARYKHEKHRCVTVGKNDCVKFIARKANHQIVNGECVESTEISVKNATKIVSL